MTVPRAIVVAILSTAWLIACLVVPPVAAEWFSVQGPALVLPPRVGEAAPPASPDSSNPATRWRGRTGRFDDDVPGRLDVYGNEIKRPVATYRVDERGTLYEVHSPQTEVPRLGPPRL